MTEFNTRYLETKNNNVGNEKIRFADEGHKYWAFSKYYSDWISTDNGIGGAPMISTTTILGKHFHFDRDRILLLIWNNPKNRLAMEMDKDYKYYGCKSINDISNIWGKGALEGTKMHAYFEDFVNILEYDKDNIDENSNIIKTEEIVKSNNVTEADVKRKNDMTLVYAKFMRNRIKKKYKDDKQEYKITYSMVKQYTFSINDSTTSYLYSEQKLQGYDEKLCLFMFLERFKLLEPTSGINFHRTELLMWHNVLHLSGMIDALLYDKNSDTYIIVDWKRCKDGVKGDPNPNNPKTKPVHKLSAMGRGRGLPAFEKIRNNDENKYGCQLTLYKHMFEHMTGKKISGMYIVVINSTLIGQPNTLDIKEVPLTRFDECIRQVFENRAREMLAEFTETLDDEHMDELIKFLPDDDEPGSPFTDDDDGVKRKYDEI